MISVLISIKYMYVYGVKVEGLFRTAIDAKGIIAYYRGERSIRG